MLNVKGIAEENNLCRLPNGSTLNFQGEQMLRRIMRFRHIVKIKYEKQRNFYENFFIIRAFKLKALSVFKQRALEFEKLKSFSERSAVKSALQSCTKMCCNLLGCLRN